MCPVTVHRADGLHRMESSLGAEVGVGVGGVAGREGDQQAGGGRRAASSEKPAARSQQREASSEQHMGDTGSG